MLALSALPPAFSVGLFTFDSAHKSPQVFDGCAEIMAKVNRFRVTFPQNATGESTALSPSPTHFLIQISKSLCGAAVQKMALLGCTMLIDFEYFEQKG